MHDEHGMGAMQGWHADPFERFEERYFSHGTPTSLVRSGRVEERDDPTITALAAAELPLPSFVAPVSPAPPLDAVETERPHGSPVLFVHRQHPIVAAFVLTIAFLTPFVAWEILTPYGRSFSTTAVAVVALALVITIWVSRRGRPAPATRSTRLG